MRVLIIDDSYSDRKLIKTQITRRYHYDVRIASGLTQALQSLNQNTYDLIICDLNLSNTNGYEVCEILYSLIGPASPKFLMISGNPFASGNSERRRCPLDGFCVKTADGKMLLESISEVLS